MTVAPSSRLRSTTSRRATRLSSRRVIARQKWSPLSLVTLRRPHKEQGPHGFAEGPQEPNRLGQVDAEDHQGHADGCGGEAAPCPGRGPGCTSLCRAHGKGAGGTWRGL